MMGSPKTCLRLRWPAAFFPPWSSFRSKHGGLPGAPCGAPKETQFLGHLEPWSPTETDEVEVVMFYWWFMGVLWMFHGCITGVSLMFHCSRHFFVVFVCEMLMITMAITKCAWKKVCPKMYRCIAVYCYIGVPVSYAQKAFVSTSEIHYKRHPSKTVKKVYLFMCAMI